MLAARLLPQGVQVQSCRTAFFWRHRTVSRGHSTAAVPEPSAEAVAKIQRLEAVAGREVGRGIAPLLDHFRGGLLAAARSIAAHPLPSLAVITGFYIPRGEAAETDGITAAAQLACGLMCAGVPVCMVTDMNCASALRVALREAGQRSPGVIALPVQCPDPEMGSLVSSILSDWESPDSGGAPVSHVLAVERAGPAADGRVYNMSKQDITCYNAPLHLLYGRHGSRHRVAIGDGGNELGMGLVPRNLLENVRHGTHIACDIPCETLVVSGVSNWGVWSLMGALAVLKKSWKPCLVESISEEVSLRVLKKTVAEGPAVDGVTGKRTFSVDGLPWQEHAKVLDEIRNIVSE